jgi:LL-diaminopimelate aminotransferase
MVSKRARSIPGNFFAQVEQRIQTLTSSGADIIRLDIGSPDLPPPGHILEALVASACDPSHHGYQPHLGTLALRQAWAKHYQQRFGVALDPQRQIIPLLGSKEGIFHTIQAWVDPGDVVLVPDPGYMTYTRGTLFAGAVPVFLPLRWENSYLPDLNAIPKDVLGKARMLWLNYPNNPTGASAGKEFLTRAVEFALQHNLLLCYDAAYSQVVLDGEQPASVLAIPGASEVAIEFNSLSKSHNMPGWRVGVAVGRADALAALFKVKTNIDSGHFRPVMDAAVAALTGDQSWQKDRNAIYRERRDIVLMGLERLGWRAFRPEAAIYVWAAIPNGRESLEFVTEVLEKVHVSLAPGILFGEHGEGFVRVALTSPTERIAEAMERMKKFNCD